MEADPGPPAREGWPDAWTFWRRDEASLRVLDSGHAVMVPTGPAMHHTPTSFGPAPCLHKLGTGTIISSNTDRTTLNQRFSRQYGGMNVVSILFVVLPLR